MSVRQEFILREIAEERSRQDEKWGADRRKPSGEWLTILTEELGEASKEVLDNDRDKLYTELVQAAAVIVAWMEDILMDLAE